jgi:geranylgeranyl pyrophosphate synthase
MSQAPIPADLAPDLERVDQIVAARTNTRSVVAAIAGPHLGDGQARLRAAVVLLAARIGSPEPEHATHAAASVALIYAATAVHRDLVDEGGRGAGQPAWGRSATLMVGDYLFALAAAEMALAPDPRTITFYSRAVMAICEGNLAPAVAAAPLDQARAQYLARAEAASAALLEAAAGAGAVCGGLPQGQIDALARYGRHLGLALHLAADARDYEGQGRAPRAGIVTLPLIYAAAAGGQALATRLGQPLDDTAVAELIAEARALGGVTRAWEDARAYARQALGQLEGLPAHPALDALRAIAERL